MKILWIPELFPPEKGGVANSALRIINNLRANGIAVDVLTISALSPHRQDDLTPPFTEVDGNFELILPKQIKIPNSLQILFHNIRRMHHLREYSLIHGFFGVYAGYVATFAAKTLKIPSVVSFRGNDVDKVLFDYSTKPFLNDTLRWADAITYLSAEMHQNLSILKPDARFYFTPNSITQKRYSCTDTHNLAASNLKSEICSSGEKLLGIVGEFKFKKALRFLIDLLPDLQNISPTKLLIIGAVSKKDLNSVRENSLITYQPFIPTDQMPSFYAAMDFLIIPSLFEGMPNVMLESMINGTINITSNVAAMKDVIKHGRNGFTFFPHDKDDFLNVIQTAYTYSENQLSEMKTLARTTAIDFTNNRETSSYISIYRDLIK